MFRISYCPPISHCDPKIKPFWRKIFVSAIFTSFLVASAALFFGGCFYNGTATNNIEKQMQAMRAQAHRKANQALIPCKTEKDILKIIGFETVNEICRNWVGSAFVVQHNGHQYLVSATHVVAKNSNFRAYKNKKEVPFEIDEWIVFDDSSLIRLKNNTFSNPYEVDMEFASTLQKRLHAEEKIECIAYGFAPRGLSKTEGHILSIYTDVKTRAQFIISSNPIVGGMSGGVLTTKEGKAIGVVSSYVNGPNCWGMYLPISNLICLIERHSELNKKKP